MPASTRPDAAHYRTRYDRIGSDGGSASAAPARMHHHSIAAEHRRKHCILLADDTTITVVDLPTGEILVTSTIDPEKS